MKIGIINPCFSLGGVEKVSVTLAENLHRLFGYETFLIDFLGLHPFVYEVDEDIKILTNQYNRTVAEKAIALLGKIKYQLTKKPYSIVRGSQSRIKGLAQLIKAHNIDVAIMSQGYLTTMIPDLKKLLPDVKFIAWQHTTYEIYMETDNKAFLPEYIDGLKQANYVVSLTKSDEKKFKLHNPNSLGIYNSVMPTSKRVTTLDNKTLLYVGRLDFYGKGIDLLLEIMVQTSPEWKLLLVGDGPDRALIEEKIKLSNLEQRVIMTGFANEKQLADYYSQSDILLSTSRWEGFGLTLIEAMAYGLPIIAFDNQGPKEILADGKYGFLIKKGDTTTVVKILEQLLNDKELREEYQQKSLQRVKDFTPDRIMKQWKELLEIVEG